MHTNYLIMVVTNAAGGLNANFDVGDIVILNDVGMHNGNAVPLD